MITLNRIHRKLIYFLTRCSTVVNVFALRFLGVTVSTKVTFEGRHRINIEPGGQLIISDGVVLGDGTAIEVGSDSTLILCPGVRLREDCTLRCYGRMTIGKNTMLNTNVFCESIGSVTIGENVLLAPQVHIYGFNHCTDSLEVPIMAQPITIGCIDIGSGAWLGAKAVINNVNIGEGAIIGAGAVVTKDVPPYTVAVGVPARTVRERRA